MIEHAARLLQQARRPVSFSGAGLSAESGIPTFRDLTANALWSRFDPQDLATPEAFRRNPALVTEWYDWRRRLVGKATPNAGHRTLASQAQMVHVTQNVDDLLERAGARQIVHLHGTLTRNRCSAECGHEENVDLEAPPALERCPHCDGLLRPSVVWFGEPLPANEWERAVEACSSCDLLIVIGTSAVVYPAAALIGMARRAGATIIQVNPASTQASALADIELIGQAGEILPRLFGSTRDGASG